ncbi:MAG: hypothetical protein AAF602_07330 [Myxococcota bacterium]
MAWLWLAWVNLAGATPPVEVRFEFVGQPECVALSYADGATTLTNHCDQPVVVDQSVLRRFRLIATGETVTLVDLSAFNLGLAGTLYRAVAIVADPPTPSPTDTTSRRPAAAVASRGPIEEATEASPAPAPSAGMHVE